MRPTSSSSRNKIFEPLSGNGVPKPKKREEGSLQEREPSIGGGSFSSSKSFISRTPVNHEKTISLTSENLSGPGKLGSGGLGGPLFGSEKGGNKKNTYWFKDNKSNNNISCFRNKKVVISGASSGIGKQTAIDLLNKGAKLALIGRNLKALCEIGSKYKGQALAIQCDLKNDAQINDMVKTILDHWGEIDILVNCAGILYEGDILSTFPQDYDQLMSVNLRSVFQLSTLFAPALEKTQGCIVNISCIYGSTPQAGLLSYCMSKAGVESLTKSLALELGAAGVRVNAVSPALTSSEMLIHRGYKKDEIEKIFDNAKKNIPLHGICKPENVSKAIIFLCSPSAKHMTGQILKLDGGRSLTSAGFVNWEGMHKMPEPIESNPRKPLEKNLGTFLRKISLDKKKLKEKMSNIDYKLEKSSWTHAVSTKKKLENKENEFVQPNKFLKKCESESNTSKTDREPFRGKFHRKQDTTLDFYSRDLSLNTEEGRDHINSRQIITRVSEVPDNINLKKKKEAKFASKPQKTLKIVKDKRSPFFLCSAFGLRCNHCKSELGLIPLAVRSGQEALRGKIFLLKKGVLKRTPLQGDERVNFQAKETTVLMDMNKKLEKVKANFMLLIEMFESLEAKQSILEKFITGFHKFLRFLYTAEREKKD